MNEIERKFLVKTIPDLSKVKKIEYERYYLYVGKGIELRIQRKSEEYELERKVATGNLSRTSDVCPLSKEEFDLLKKLSDKSIIRDAYQISDKPDISIKIYHGDYEGLVRAEFEFESEEEAKTFVPPEWCGKEITDSDLGRDSRLMGLEKDGFEKNMKTIFG
jgi:adenylate cyclase